MPDATPTPAAAYSPPIVGVCGGVGAGKSAVAAAFARRGAAVVDADRLAHLALDQEDVKTALLREFGSEILGDDGRIARPKLKRLVFGAAPDATLRRKALEAVVHPRVRKMLEDAIAEHAAADPKPPLIVLDVPLLVEGPVGNRCDAVVFVDAPPEIRRARTAKERGWSEDDHRSREAAQASTDEKRARATYVVRNDGTTEALARRVDEVFEAILAAKSRRGGS
jgi:dephospho-CoA kinase